MMGVSTVLPALYYIIFSFLTFTSVYIHIGWIKYIQPLSSLTHLLQCRMIPGLHTTTV